MINYTYVFFPTLKSFVHVRAYEIKATLLLGTVSVEINCLKATGARGQPNVINLVKFHEYEE